VCLRAKYLKKLCTDFDDIFKEVRRAYVLGTNRLAFGKDLDSSCVEEEEDFA